MNCIKPLVPYLVHSKPSEMFGGVYRDTHLCVYSDSSFVLSFCGAGVTRECPETRSPSWWTESRLRSRHMRRLYTAVPVTACRPRTPECRLCCQKGLGPVGEAGRGSRTCRTRGPVLLQAARKKPRASLDCVKPGALGAQRLCWCTRQPPLPGWPAQGTAERHTKKPRIRRTVTSRASRQRTTRMVGGLPDPQLLPARGPCWE